MTPRNHRFSSRRLLKLLLRLERVFGRRARGFYSAEEKRAFELGLQNLRARANINLPV